MNKIKFHFFNVNHGDSILIEIETNDNKFYLVVDTYFIKKNGKLVNPALEYLKSQNAKTISAIIITHFHKDHYTGIEDYFANFQVNKLCIPPVISRKSASFDKIIERYKNKIEEVARKTNDKQIFNELKSLTFLIKHIKNNETSVQEIEGRESIFRISEINESIGIVYLPVAKFKGNYINKILDGNFILNNFPEVNDMSIAICFTFFGNKILLTGDSTLNQWREHIKQMRVGGINNLNVDIVKAAHHGSKNNNSENLYQYFFNGAEKKRHIIISANGKSHPDDVIFDLINKYKLIPHCTNLANQCANDNDYYAIPRSLTEASPFIIHYRVETEPTPCQGDITVQMDTSNVLVNSSNSIRCIYH